MFASQTTPKIARPFSRVGVYSACLIADGSLSALADGGRKETNFRSRRVKIAILTVLVIAIISLGALTLSSNPFGAGAPKTNAQKENQILFVGPGFNDTVAVRNSTIAGGFSVNMTTTGLMQFTLDDETYYPPTTYSAGNGTTVPCLSSGRCESVRTFQSGSIEVGGDIFNFVSSKPCNATIASTQTNGSTVTAFATCNASTTPAVITTGYIHIRTAGVWQFDYSLNVPSNATIGTYLIDVLIQNASDQNFANLSNNLVYVLTVNVTS